MTDAEIKQAVNRFLSWPLSSNFRPDAGISFDPVFNKGTAYEMKHEPRGTNLFDASQAEEMLRYVLQQPSTLDGLQDRTDAAIEPK